MYVTFFQIKKILESNKKIPYHIVKYLIKTDFLLNNITQILPEYTEPPIYFEPTYKRDSLTGNFKLKKNKYGLCPVGRLPGYTDRVMIKTLLQTKNTLYDSISIIGNDHFPVILITQIFSINIAVLTWNIGNANPKKICPNLLKTIFDTYGTKPDILIIGFQEADKNTIPDISVWNGIYNSNIRLHGNSFKSLLGHIIGFGLETTILWDNKLVHVKQILKESNRGTVLKEYTQANSDSQKNLCPLHVHWLTFMHHSLKIRLNTLTFIIPLLHILINLVTQMSYYYLVTSIADVC